MKSIRFFSRMFSAVFVVALGLCLLTSAGTANADGEVAPMAIPICAGCVIPNNAPCAFTPGAGCFFLRGCTLCFCVPDPILPGVACL